MKRIFLALVISTVLFLMGCEKNSINDPNSAGTVGKNEFSNGNTTRGSISLDRILVIYGMGNDYYQIKGNINYTNELIKQYPDQTAERYDVKLDISVNAQLSDIYSSDPKNKNWTISSDSEDLVYVSREGIYVLYRSYPVIGRKDNLQLVCTFIVTTDGVGLDNVELKVPKNTSAG
jgi:hypothetical protein